jgi:glycosyltransferase involved in cell wall biosynthesis
VTAPADVGRDRPGAGPAGVAAAGPPSGAPARRRISLAYIGGRGVGGKYSGIETIYETVAPRLAARGHDVTIYCRRHFTPAGYELPGVRLVRTWSPGGKHLDTPWHSASSTLHALARRHDVVHFHALGASLLAWAPRLRGIASVTTVHGLDWQRAKWGRVARAVLRAGEWASVRAPHAATAVSRHLAEHLREKYRRHVVYVPNGVDETAPPPPEGVRRRGLEPGRYLLYAGRLSAEKGVHDLIEAHARAGTGLPLVIAGGGVEPAYEAELRRAAGRDVHFLGYVDSAALAELYAHAFLFVLPSHLEGLSVALLEAMSHGCPVAASDIPANLEVLDGLGFTFPPGDPARLADLLRDLAADPARVRAEGEALRRRVHEEYGWDHVAEMLETVYLEVLESTPR